MPLATWLRALLLCLATAHICCSAFDPRLRQLQSFRSTQQPPLHSRVVPANATVAQDNDGLRQYQRRYHMPSRATPPEVAKYRNEGNYYQPQPQPQPLVAPYTQLQVDAAAPQQFYEYLPQLRQPPVTYDQRVWHVEPLSQAALPPPQPQVDASQMRYTAVQLHNGALSATPQPTAATTTTHKRVIASAKREAARQEGANGKKQKEKVALPLAKTSRAYHDIFQRYDGPHQLSFGHVEQRPAHFEQRFATLDKGNRYRGEVLWADAAGGYGEQRWDMAQGKLRR